MERAIVTGANGFLGRSLISELSKYEIEIIALDINFDNSLPRYKNVKCINCYDKSIDDLLSELNNDYYDYFFHFAWKATSGLDRADYITQLENAKNVCENVLLASKLNCKKFIYASSINEMETYEYLQGDDIKPTGGYIYGVGKLAGHLMGEVIAYQNKVDFIPVIITNIYGAGEKSSRLINASIRKLLNNEHCSFTHGNQMYDFIYINDAIKTIIAVAFKGKPFHRYYIGSGKTKPLKYFLMRLRDVVNKDAELGFGEIPFNGVDIDYTQFKLNKVYEDTGFECEISFEEGIYLTKQFIENEE